MNLAALGTRQKTRLKRPNVNLGSDQRDFVDNSDPNEDGYRNENQNNRLIEYIRSVDSQMNYSKFNLG